ncbi:MAG TPA: hypothetical protein VG818_09915 [Gemmatimonadaceae bacterium]|nr:hypothetical protein [Gemmatimonadaceae bacterium]
MKRTLLVACVVSAAACASRAQEPPRAAAPVPAEQARPLASLAAQRVVVTPVFSVRRDDALGWGAAIARPRATMRALDSAIVAEFDERGMRRRWYFAPDLDRSYQVNPTYSPDPYDLAESGLRNGLPPGERYGEPLATQLRTLIALHDDARLVLMPVEVRFEKDGAQGRAVLRLVLVDARLVESRWTGEVRSDPAPAFGPAVLASLASHFADMVASP